MREEEIRKLLKKVWAQQLSVEDAIGELRLEPSRALAFAHIDHQRSLRCGFPEVILCEGKASTDVGRIAAAILAESDQLLATRASPEDFAAIQSVAPDAVHHSRARCVTVRRDDPPLPSGRVLILSAGTSDVPVAEEARVTAEAMGREVESVHDVGVAGLHRLFQAGDRILAADAIVVVAGMEGALASVVGGLASVPVIAVPTVFYREDAGVLVEQPFAKDDSKNVSQILAEKGLKAKGFTLWVLGS